MKLILSCHRCHKELNIKADILVELNESGLYRFSCDRGHESEVGLQNCLFELLFDLGVMALLEGYTRESVVNFSSSLERFYEYFITVISFENDVEINSMEKTWKLMSKQSERQLGAFLILYSQKYKTDAPSLPNKLIEFRNNVVHKGKVPSTDETIGDRPRFFLTVQYDGNAK